MDKSGKTLGGGTSNTSSSALTPEQLRERRIQALSSSSRQQQTRPSTDQHRQPEQGIPNKGRGPKKTTFMVDDDNQDEDSELQRALALSLQTMDDEEEKGTTVSTMVQPQPADHSSPCSPIAQSMTPASVLKDILATEKPFDVSAFHEIMWDAATTTEHDKTRWVSEAIRTLSGSTTTAAAAIPSPVSRETTMLSQLVETEHPIWGLSQHFGGPCGVLAAVQAEALKILIWGTRVSAETATTTSEPQSSDAAPRLDLMSPKTPSQLLTGVALDRHVVRIAIARAIATILTRAATRPAVAADATSTETTEPRQMEDCDTVQIVLPARLTLSDQAVSLQEDGGPMTSPPAITWTDLEPWPTLAGGKPASISSSESSSRLRVYTIQLKQKLAAEWSKRQKTDTESSRGKGASENGDDAAMTVETRHDLLGRLVGDFLLQESETSIAPIDYLLREGGVLLLVMSLVSCRQKQLIQSEFDDPAGSRLTAQFGHCSQELMNLLLTGQATSNVFDNNLSPDKGILCRGVQQQSDIGYLSQLESLRYCQVGSYYKNSVFPIWVVGSTSHFTILFGDLDAVKESASDILLERCRRAFKAVEGGDENGYIPSGQLSAIFQALDVKVDGAEQAIVASIEVPGAGIIVWQDFWRVASRLMTGSSVESVLNSDEHSSSAFADDNMGDLPALIPVFGSERSQDATHTMDCEHCHTEKPGDKEAPRNLPWPMNIKPDGRVLSDEELARKLQAEWDAEDGSGASDRAASGSPSTIPEHDLASQQFGPQLPNVERLESSENKFSLYHYNGLRGGKLSSFRIARLGADDAVGASIGLNHDIHSNGMHAGLDDIIYTKWPSCVVDWMGQSSPDID